MSNPSNLKKNDNGTMKEGVSTGFLLGIMIYYFGLGTRLLWEIVTKKEMYFNEKNTSRIVFTLSASALVCVLALAFICRFGMFRSDPIKVQIVSIIAITIGNFFAAYLTFWTYTTMNVSTASILLFSLNSAIISILMTVSDKHDRKSNNENAKVDNETTNSENNLLTPLLV